MGGWDGWRDFNPGKTPASSSKPEPMDRGSRLLGAKRCIVTPDLQLLDHAFAKNAGVTGEFFQSRKEAKFYIQLEIQFRAGLIRPLPDKPKWRQVRFPLLALRADGLKEKVADLVLDFAFERKGHRPVTTLFDDEHGSLAAGTHNVEVWTPHYQDVKPKGARLEGLYLLKKKIFQAQYGVLIEEL